MILEERNYEVRPGAAHQYLALWEEHGRAAQERILGVAHGVWVGEIGHLNVITYHWLYDSFEDRATRRRALMADPDFAVFRGHVRALLVAQQNRILVPGTARVPSEKEMQ